MLERIASHSFHPRFIHRDSIVLDLGANRGRFSHQMIERFGCRCVAVEASSDMVAAIAPHPNLQVINRAICDRATTLEFHISSDPTASSLNRADVHDFVKTVSVQGVTLEGLVTELGLSLDRIALIKFDIEGAEVPAIQGCRDSFLKSIPQLTVEFHDFNRVTPVEQVRAVIDRLAALGFHAIRMSGKHHNDVWFVNRRLCPVSAIELWWSRIFLRNWRGIVRLWHGRGGEE